MEMTHKSRGASTGVNSDYPVRCTEEVLLPLFTDESLKFTMDSIHPPASPSIPAALPELRLVLLGRKGAGKSAARNTILGGVGGFETGKPTEECVKSQADVGGLKVTVVDTPGWEWYYPLNSTPNWVKRETLRSMSLCLPGPHAVLLVVRSCASMTEDYIQEIQEHLEPLGREVWEHTILLFTRGDELGLTSMEHRILTSGPTLQRLLQMCGNRYHVLDNRNKGDAMQVKELIEKLMDMVARKTGGSRFFELDNTVLLGLEADRKRRGKERRKKQRQLEVQMQRATIKDVLKNDDLQGLELDAHQSFSMAPHSLPEVRLVLLGERETGKSSAGNTILGQTGFFQVGVVTQDCIRQQAEVSKWLVTVVDTPGWEAGIAGGTPERVKREIVNSVALCPPGPHALLLALRVDTLVLAGHVKEHLELLGEGVWRYSMLLFTHGDQLREGVNIEQHIQGGGRDLLWLLDKCRGRYHVISNQDGQTQGNGCSDKVTELLQKVEKVAAMNRCEAFSGLVQEVRDLSHQRNKRFNQRLNNMGDKILRQEVELKKLREREMKSIRWFFERKKKVKSLGKSDIQREEVEDEDRRTGEMKSDIGELEERMQWLTEDKEREIQDLIIEKEKVRVALNQNMRERDEATLKLELKERETDLLKERIDEQQLKLLDLERASVEDGHERKRREESIKVMKREIEKLEETIVLYQKEKTEWMEKADSLKTEMKESRRQFDYSLKRKAQETKMEMVVLEERLRTEMEVKLSEKDHLNKELRKNMMEEKQVILDNKKEIERKMEENGKEMQIAYLQQQEVMARKLREMEEMMEAMKVHHLEELDQRMMDSEEQKERMKQQHESEKRNIKQEIEREIKELKGQLAKEAEELVQAKGREIAELEQMYVVQMEKIKEEKESVSVNLKQEKEKELEALKQQHHEDMESKIKEMEKLMEERRAEYLEESNRKMKGIEIVVERMEQEHKDKIRNLKEERKREINELTQQFDQEIETKFQERQAMIRELEQKYVMQLEEQARENEKEKELIIKNHKKHILKNMQERDRLIELRVKELKNQHVKVLEDKIQECEKEKEKIAKTVVEKEREMAEIKVSLEEMKERLQQKGDKETDHLTEKKDMEQKLEEREREIEILQERLKELDQKLRQRDKERELDHLNHKEQIQKKIEEKDKVIENLNQHIKDIDEILRQEEEERGEMMLNQKKEAEERLRDKEHEMEEMKLHLLNDRERLLEERKTEIDSLKQQAEHREATWREEQRKKEERGESEKRRLKELIDQKMEEIKEAQHHLAERDSEIDQVKRECANYLKTIEELEEKQASTIIQIHQSHTELQRKIDAEMMEKLQEKEEELLQLRQRDGDKDKELAQLRLTIQQAKSELKDLTNKMEKEMANMIQQYEKEIERRNKSVESIAKERDRAVTLVEEERQKSLFEVKEKYEESQRSVEEMRKEADNLKIKLQKEIEEEVRKKLEGHEDQIKRREAEIESIIKEKDGQVRVLKEANDELKVEMERMKERDGEAERQLNKMRGDFQKKLQEKQSEFRVKEQQIKEEFLKREKEVVERVQVPDRNVEALRKRGCELDVKEEELVEREAILESNVHKIGKWEATLEQKEQEEREKHRQHEYMREQELQKRERELEMLLSTLESKQKELSCHGQDLQKKVKGLKDQGRELIDREHCLRNEEQELLKWNSELQMQQEKVNTTMQKLEEMARDLALLKEELHNKEKKLKESLKKLGKWEQNLKEREEELVKRDRKREGNEHGRVQEGNSFDLTDSNFHLANQDIQGEKEKGRASDRESAKEQQDRRMKKAMSAVGSNNHHPETLKLIVMSEVKEGMAGTGAETSKTKDPREAEVNRDSPFLSAEQGHRRSNFKESHGSVLRVMVLGESWSARSPSGVTILCGEASKQDGSTFRHWRGQVAGRHLAIVEPVGLRWREGPETNRDMQRKCIRDSISWCHPGPHIILLLVPAFLNCTWKFRRAMEEHMSLLGEEIWQRTLVLFTWGEILGESVEQHILRNGELMGLVERCRGRYHMITSKKSNSLTEGLLEKMEDIIALNRL